MNACVMTIWRKGVMTIGQPSSRVLTQLFDDRAFEVGEAALRELPAHGPDHAPGN